MVIGCAQQLDGRLDRDALAPSHALHDTCRFPRGQPLARRQGVKRSSKGAIHVAERGTWGASSARWPVDTNSSVAEGAGAQVVRRIAAREPRDVFKVRGHERHLEPITDRHDLPNEQVGTRERRTEGADVRLAGVNVIPSHVRARCGYTSLKHAPRQLATSRCGNCTVSILGAPSASAGGMAAGAAPAGNLGAGTNFPSLVLVPTS